MKQIIATDGAPEAIGPYSQGVRVGDLLFLSGQIAIDPATGDIVGQSAGEQTRQVLENLQAVLEAAGGSLRNVVKTTVYLHHMKDYAEVNEVYAEYFEDEPPARAAMQVEALPREVLVEIEAIAHLAGGPGAPRSHASRAMLDTVETDAVDDELRDDTERDAPTP